MNVFYLISQEWLQVAFGKLESFLNILTFSAVKSKEHPIVIFHSSQRKTTNFETTTNSISRILQLSAKLSVILIHSQRVQFVFKPKSRKSI